MGLGETVGRCYRDARHPVLAEAFTRRGYVTAGFVANLVYCQAEYGLGRGFVHYDDHQTSITSAMRATSLGSALVHTLKLRGRSDSRVYFDWKSAEQINHDFLRWLSKRQEARPYFAFLSYFDAHGPTSRPKNLLGSFRRRSPEEISGRDPRIERRL